MSLYGKPWQDTVEMHPCNFMLDFLQDLGVKEEELHACLGVSREELEPVLQAEAPVTPDLASRLGRIYGRFGFDADFWIRLQNRYDETVARNDAREAAGINTTVYKVTDTDGRIVKYGVTTDFVDAVDQEGIHHNNYDIRNLTWYLHSDVAQRKLDKLQRALEARRRREREAAAERSAARTTAPDVRELAARAA